MVRWWDRFWGALWTLGSLGAAVWTARWFAAHAAPADLGRLRYGLIAFAALFGLLVGALALSLAVIALTSGLEWLFARLGHPLPRPAVSDTPLTDRESASPAEIAVGERVPDGAGD